MNIGLYLGATALNALERWQDTISSNLMSGNVPGFRKRETIFGVQPSGSINPSVASGQQPQAGQFPMTYTGINFRPGEIDSTGRELDVAIDGKGFFEIQRPDGTRSYTRSGSFFTNTDRTLVDSQGNAVLGEGGAPVQLLPDGGSVVISRDGTISQGAGDQTQQIGKLAVYAFDNPQALQPISGGQFLAAGQTPQLVEKPVVVQNALEASNVTPMAEMVSLIEVSRAYQAAQKVVSSRDDTMDKSIRALT